MSFSDDFHLWSFFLNPHVSFIVMQLSQSTPSGKPVGGTSCSGVPKSPAAPSYLFIPFMLLRALPTRLLSISLGWIDLQNASSSLPCSSVQSGTHSPSNHITPMSP